MLYTWSNAQLRRNQSCCVLRQTGLDTDKVLESVRSSRWDAKRWVCPVRRGKRFRTTISNDDASRLEDLVDRIFAAMRPNKLWVTDFTHVPTWSGMAYCALVLDVFSRKIVGWRVSTSMKTSLVLDALETAGVVPGLSRAETERPESPVSFWGRLSRHALGRSRLCCTSGYRLFHAISS